MRTRLRGYRAFVVALEDSVFLVDDGGHVRPAPFAHQNTPLVKDIGAIGTLRGLSDALASR